PIVFSSLSLSHPLSFFFYCSVHHLDLHSFPTRRSSDLQDQHFRFLVRGAGYGAEAVALAGEVQGGLPGASGGRGPGTGQSTLNRSEEHTSELQSRRELVCRLLLEKKKKTATTSSSKNTR